jgi:hypothetical protein
MPCRNAGSDGLTTAYRFRESGVTLRGDRATAFIEDIRNRRYRI